MAAADERQTHIPEKLLKQATEVFSSLSDDQQQHLALAVREKLTYPQIAERLDSNPELVKAKLRESLESLFVEIDKAAASGPHTDDEDAPS